jgi:hypothetical protein
MDMHVIDGTKLGNKSKDKMTDGLKALIKTLQPLLDNRFALVHTLTIVGRREKIDALLAVPHGALVLKVETLTGRYRCLGDNWYVWDKKVKDFVGTTVNPTRELLHGLVGWLFDWLLCVNPTRELLHGQRLIEAQLTGHGLGSTVPLDSAVIFMDAKLQLEHMQPPARLVISDAVVDFFTQLAATPTYVEKRDIERTLEVFGAHAAIAGTPRPGEQPVNEASAAPRKRKRKPRGPLGLSRAQLALVIGLVIVYLVITAALLYFLWP